MISAMELIFVIDIDWLYQTYPYRSVSCNMKTILARYLPWVGLLLLNDQHRLAELAQWAAIVG